MAAVNLFLGTEEVADLCAPEEAQPKQRDFPEWKAEEFGPSAPVKTTQDLKF